MAIGFAFREAKFNRMVMYYFLGVVCNLKLISEESILHLSYNYGAFT